RRRRRATAAAADPLPAQGAVPGGEPPAPRLGARAGPVVTAPPAGGQRPPRTPAARGAPPPPPDPRRASRRAAGDGPAPRLRRGRSGARHRRRPRAPPTLDLGGGDARAERRRLVPRFAR